MHRDIAILREAIVKIAQILADKNVIVTQQGIQAFVEYARDGSIKRVNLPYIPDNASEELIVAIQGFLDHEIAHVLFTVSKVVIRATDDGPLMRGLHNILEDTMIERLMARKFRGSQFNLAKLHGFFLDEMTNPGFEKAMAAGDMGQVFNCLIVVMCRAWSGQRAFQDYMAAGDKWNLPPIQIATEKIGEDLIARVPLCNTTYETYDLAAEMLERIRELAAPPPEAGSRVAGKGEEGSGDPDSDGAETPTMKSKRKDDEDDEPTDGGSEEGDDRGDKEDADKGGADEDADSGEEGSGSEAGEAGDDVDDDGAEAGHSDPGDGDSSYIEGFDEEALAKELEDDFHDVMAELLSTEDETKLADYRVFTKDYDKIATYEPPRPYRHSDGARELEETCRHMVGVMQKDLERLMQARSMTYMTPGYRSGRLHAASLHRLRFNDDRVFRRKNEAINKNIAVSLLLDCSGSMSGEKFDTAIVAGYALSQTLEKIGIAHEVLGFTTLGYDKVAGGDAVRRRMQEQEERMGVRYSRYEPIHMPIYKSFEERLTPPVKQRFAHARHAADLLYNNIDGECVEIAARRLALRRKNRKTLLVLSDGQPSAAGDRASQSNHLKRVVSETVKMGVECVGIGIMSGAVAHYYPKFTILHDIEDLPGQVMRDLRTVLMPA